MEESVDAGLWSTLKVNDDTGVSPKNSLCHALQGQKVLKAEV